MADKQLWQVIPQANDVKNDDGVIIGGQTAGTRYAPLTLIANFVHNLWAAFINALTSKTSFANGDKFPVVNGSTATAMEASKLLELTAQNAYKTNVAYKSYSDIIALNIGYIDTSGDIGSVVNLTPSSNEPFRHAVVDCTPETIVKVKGLGGSSGRLWCFIDEENKIISHAGAGAEEDDYKTLVAPPGTAKIVVTMSSASTSPAFDLLLGLVIDEAYDELSEGIDGAIEYTANNSIYLADKTEELMWDFGTINTSGSIGSIVTLTPIASASWNHIVVECKEGFVVKVKGLGGSNGRLWCFIDEQNRIISNSVASASEASYKTIIAPKHSSKLVVNVSNAPSSPVAGLKVSVTANANMANIEATIGVDYVFVKNEDDDFAKNYNYVVQDNVAIGDVVNTTRQSSVNWSFTILDCKEGEQFKVQGYGGANARLWAFIDVDSKLLSIAGATEIRPEPYLIVAPAGAKKLIVNSQIAYAETHVWRGQKHQDGISTLRDFAEKINEKVNGFGLVDFDFNYNIPDFSSEVANTDFTDAGLRRMLEQVYSKIDSLILEHPSLITKCDAAEECGISYPAYANGVPAGNPDYLETPAYKTYMYKVSNSNVGAGNTTSCKKGKIFIISGVHGYEVAAPFNCYLFIKMLAEGNSSAFEILSAFDLYIMPCVNGYGIYHYQRVNGNGVDINRNYPTIGWQVSGVPGDDTYSGPSAASEFETQLVTALVESIKPDIFIDHHNYFDGSDQQFYTIVSEDSLLHPVYQTLVNLSKKFIQNFPEVFGSEFRLFQATDAITAPKMAQRQEGHSSYWGYQCGFTQVSATVEICRNLNYSAGSPTHGEDYTDKVFKVAYITLIDHLMRFAKTL